MTTGVPDGLGRDATDSQIPAYVLRPASGTYRALNPLTKIVVALAESALAFIVGGWTGPLAVIAIVLACGLAAGVVRSLARLTLVTAPIVISVLLINTLVVPGAGDLLFRLGPIAPSRTGLALGAQVALRIVAFSLALTLAFVTTDTDDLLADLERRGVGRRAIFVVGAGLQAVSRTLVRAGEIVDAQRARGLDTEGRPWRRVRGLLPLAGPLIFGALTDVEQQTLALEARAFSARGRRTLLRLPADSSPQRLLRWSAVGLVIVAIVAARADVLRLP